LITILVLYCALLEFIGVTMAILNLACGIFRAQCIVQVSSIW